MIEVYENALRETAIFRHAEHYCRVGLNIPVKKLPPSIAILYDHFDVFTFIRHFPQSFGKGPSLTVIGDH